MIKGTIPFPGLMDHSLLYRVSTVAAVTIRGWCGVDPMAIFTLDGDDEKDICWGRRGGGGRGTNSLCQKQSHIYNYHYIWMDGWMDGWCT